MKDGKIDFKSVGIAITLAIAGTAEGSLDFMAQKVNVLNFLQDSLKINFAAQLPASTDVTAIFGFSGISVFVLVLAIVCIAMTMYGLRGMA